MSPEDLEIEAAQRGEHGQSGHVSVLLKEAIEFLAVRRGGTYIDATVGLGGHSFEIARRLGARGHLIGVDKDPAALERARKKLHGPNAEGAGEVARPDRIEAGTAGPSTAHDDPLRGS